MARPCRATPDLTEDKPYETRSASTSLSSNALDSADRLVTLALNGNTILFNQVSNSPFSTHHHTRLVLTPAP